MDGVQGGSVVKVEEEEETSLRERWVVTCGRRCVRGGERRNRGIEGERERKTDLGVATCSLNFRAPQI